jgi:hypothetical protein
MHVCVHAWMCVCMQDVYTRANTSCVHCLHAHIDNADMEV